MSRGGLRILSATLALAVFLVDVLTPLEGAVAVLYVVAILLVARTSRRMDIIAAAVGCILLTIGTYLLSHDLAAIASPAVRAAVSLADSTMSVDKLMSGSNRTLIGALKAFARFEPFCEGEKELVCVCVDGRRTPVLFTISFPPSDDRNILAFVVDITERKQAQDLLLAA